MAEGASRLREAGATIAAISVDGRHDSAALARELQLGFPLLEDRDLTIARHYGVVEDGAELALPAAFVIDRAQQIRWRQVGETILSRASLDELLEAVAAL